MRLHITHLKIPAFIGVYEHEKQARQELRFSLEVEYHPVAAMRSDSLADTVDYDALAEALKEVAGRKHYHLLESLLEAAGEALMGFKGVKAVTIEIGKPGALKDAGMVSVSERFER